MDQDLAFNKNEDQYKQLLDKLRNKRKRRCWAAAKKAEEQHQRGKLTARERIDYLLDKGSDFVEVGLFAGDGMYADQGGCPSGGVVTGLGYVKGRLCVVVANDATVKAGAWFPITAKKNLRAQEIAYGKPAAVIYLVRQRGCFSAHARDEIFPDKEHLAGEFRNNARMSAMGICADRCHYGQLVTGSACLPDYV